MLIVNYHSESGNLTNSKPSLTHSSDSTALNSGNCNRPIRSTSILNYEGAGSHVRGVRPNRAANFLEGRNFGP